MSHRALQHWMVRMLHDPQLVDRVYDDPESTLEHADLTARERDWLVRPDRRAWTTDPYRRARLLTGLIDEYPAAMAVALRTGGTTPLLAFFAADPFVTCVHERGSLALAFGEWLAGGIDAAGPGEVANLARVELAIASVRRASPPPANPANDPLPDERLVRAPTLDAFAVPDGTVARLAEIRGRLGEHIGPLRDAVADTEFALPPRSSAASEAREYVLVDLGPNGAQLGFGPAELVALLDAAQAPVATATLWRRASELGADPGDEQAIVAGLLHDGSLVRAATVD